jgi:hypothetical protein
VERRRSQDRRGEKLRWRKGVEGGTRDNEKSFPSDF